MSTWGDWGPAVVAIVVAVVYLVIVVSIVRAVRRRADTTQLERTVWTVAAVLFPLTGFATYWVVRRLLPQVAERKVIEEAAWTDHAASTEEGVAARDDLRTALDRFRATRARSDTLAVEYGLNLCGNLD